MANYLVSGPIASGKRALARKLIEEQSQRGIVVSFTELYRVLSGDQRLPDGTWPPRDPALLPLVEYVRRQVLNQAVLREIPVATTNSDSDPARREKLMAALGPAAVERVIDVSEDVIRERLADRATGELSAQCAAAVRRWFK